jgi:hypothetical protein
MVTYRDAFEELKLCFQLDHRDALTLWRIAPDGEDLTMSVFLLLLPWMS